MASPRANKKALAPPPTLSPAAVARWRAVVPALAAAGPFDRESLATYCQVWVRWQEAEQAVAKSGSLIKAPTGRVVPNPYLAVSKQASRDALALEARLGIGGDGEEGAEDGRLISRRELAVAMGVHMQTITKWEREGMPIAKRGRKGRPSLYRLADVRAWHEAREAAAKTGAGVDVAAARASKETWQGKLAEQSYLVRSRELLPRADVEKAWSLEIAAVRTIIMSAYTTNTDRVFRAATLEGRAGVERELQAIADAALLELANPDRPLPGETPS